MGEAGGEQDSQDVQEERAQGYSLLRTFLTKNF